MCGIAGIIQLRNENGMPPERIGAMTAALRHRGPDESGLYLDDRIALGHARLSIIDLSSGTQPIHNEDQSLWIVFNGEIFNYPELRDDLISRGHRFYTTSDTETILHLYEEKGADCLHDLNGQFAFAIWDARKHTCFLARDRAGIRPLYYTQCGEELIFASEIKALFANPCVPREIDPVGLDQIFTFWAPLPGRTPFKGIHSLPAGHSLTVRNGTIRTARYWDAPFVPKHRQIDWSPERISEHIQTLLKEATRIRLRADVPVGTYLSGGLDSSGITALVAQNFDPNVRTFGISFKEAAYDESSYQRAMVDFLGVLHTELPVSNEEIGAALPKVIWHSEKPLLRTAPVPLYLLSQTVRKTNLKVVLTGEGSDEVFGGYNIFREAAIRRFWARFPDSQKRAGLIPNLYPYLFKDPRLNPMLQAFFARGLGQTEDPLYSHLLRWTNTARIKTFFSNDLKEAIGSYCGTDEIRERLPVEFHTWDSLAKAQYLEMNIFMSNYLLSSQGDRMAMGNSVEIRMPYLDPHVMRFMGRVPAIWKILGMKEKYILKKSFCGILPPEIALRPKNPYRAPVPGSLLGGGPKGQLREKLSSKSLNDNGLFDPDKVARLITRTETNPRSSETDDMALAGIVTTQLLCDQFINEFSQCEPTPILPQSVTDRRRTAHPAERSLNP